MRTREAVSFLARRLRVKCTSSWEGQAQGSANRRRGAGVPCSLPAANREPASQAHGRSVCPGGRAPDGHAAALASGLQLAGEEGSHRREVEAAAQPPRSSAFTPCLGGASLFW